ncbi:MAG: DUF2017 family protein [Planctomycetaceae bacterium]
MPRLPIRRARGGGVVLDLPEPIRAFVRGAVEAYRDLLTSEEAADDPAVARLSPTAYADDPLRDIAFDERRAEALGRGRFEAIEAVLATVEAERLTEEEADAWMRTCNDIRLVLGTRLNLTEDSAPEDFEAEPATAAAFEQYAVLSELVQLLVEARPL